MSLKYLLLTTQFLLLPISLIGQSNGVDPSELIRPLKDSWPTYNGDYTGKRYSALKQIDQTNVKNLTLGWFVKVTAGAPAAGGGRGGGRGTVNVGGEGTVDFPVANASIKATPLEVDGTLYFSTPDNAWAVDARDGRELWHYFWKTRGATHIGNRGIGIYGNWLYMEHA